MSNPVPPPAAPVVEEEEQKHILDSGPPEEEFWEKYSSHLEFPLSTVLAILLHVAVGAIIIFMFHLANRGEDRNSVPLTLIDPGGFDESGQGSQGSGGKDDPITKGDSNPFEKSISDILPDPSMIPQAKADLKSLMQDLDPNSEMPITAENVAAFSTLDKELQKKLLGMQRGAGDGGGSGFDGTKGAGPGGTGADSTRARTMRWVLRFRTANGADYVDQLKAMGGVIIVPIPPENKQMMFFSDLSNPTNGKIGSDADLRQFGGLLQFSDGRQESVQGVSQVLGLTFRPKAFWAIFPKKVEKDLEMKEKGYRNRRAEDIEETVFSITVRAGQFEAVVVDQTKKK